MKCGYLVDNIEVKITFHNKLMALRKGEPPERLSFIEMFLAISDVKKGLETDYFLVLYTYHIKETLILSLLLLQ